MGTVNTVREKFKTLLWFLKKPEYIPHIFQVLKRKNYKKHEETRDESIKWCKNHETSPEEILRQLTGINNNEELKNLFPEIMNYAYEKEKQCPVKMGGEGAVSFLYHLVKKKQFAKIIETGVAYGWSSLAILLAIKDMPDAKLISNDMPYIKMNNDDYVGCIIPDNLKSKWELQRLPDVKGIPLAIKKFNGQIDLCHYDSDKTYSGRMFAYPLLWESLMPGGVFISDDIQDNIAFKSFAERMNYPFWIFEHRNKYVGVILKKSA